MSTTRSTFSQITSINNRLDSINRENTLILPNMSDSKIIFVKNYNKNRNLSKSLAIKLPYIQEKFSNNLHIFENEPETESSIKSILKNTLRKKLRIDIPEEREFKSVKFIDEVDEEDAYHFDKTTNNCLDVKSEKLLTTIKIDNEFSKESFDLNITHSKTLKNNKKIQFSVPPINNKGKKENSFIDNSQKKKENNKYIITNGAEKKQTKIKSINNNLAEIINVPSYRNYNIYRTNREDFLKQININEEPNAKCKCCTIF